MFTFDKLVQSVAAQHNKVSKQPDAGTTETLTEAWAACSRYVVSLLDQKKGLNIPNFAKIGWLIEKQRVGPPLYRPHFQVTEQFANACNLASDVKKRLTTIQAGGAELCALEDFNYSKAAIKYSEKLTKDQIFGAMRDLLRRLSETLAEGKDVDIQFGEVGRLTVRGDKDPRFHFSSELYTKEGLEVPSGSTFSPVAPTPSSFSKDAPAAARGLGLDARNSAPSRAVRQPTPAPLMPLQEEAADYSDNFWTGEEEPRSDRGPPSRRSMASSYSAGSLPGATSSNLTNQQYKREVAYKEAMDRQIYAMEARATEAMQEREAWSSHVSECLEQERDEIQEKRERNGLNLKFLQHQMALGEHRRKDQRKEDIIAASAHDFPKVGGDADDPQQAAAFVAGQQERMRTDLDEQVRTNNTLRNLAKQRERTLEVNQLEANKQEMAMLRNAEHAKKAYDREALATAWNSDIRMKNIWKAIDSHNKVGSHEPQVMTTDSIPQSRLMTGQSTRSAGRMMTGSSRRKPLGASSSLGRLQGNN